MFWGLVLENGKRYNQVVDDGFHISMAVLEPQSNRSSTVSVMMEREKTEFLLCTLQNGKCQQQALDLNFAEGEAVTLFLNGEGIVHLTGYVIEAEPDGPEFPYSDEDSEEETINLEQLKRLKRKAEFDKAKQASPKKTKLSEEDSEDYSDSDEGNLEDSDDDEESMVDSDDLQELMLKQKQGQSPKKAAGKSPFLGVPLNKQQAASTKPSATPPKKAASSQPPTPKNTANSQPSKPKIAANTQAVTPKSAKKQQAVSKDASKISTTPTGKQSQSPKMQTPTVNGDQSLNQSLEGSKRKKKKKKKNKNLNESSSTVSPGATPAKISDEKGQKVKKLPGGVIVEDVHVGNGPEAKSGKMAHVHYIGKLPSGKEFDSCLKGQAPFKFRLGTNEVIKGWDIGIQGMKVGGRRTITVPPNQGYGNKNMGEIPPNSTLKFDVQLVAVN